MIQLFTRNLIWKFLSLIIGRRVGMGCGGSQRAGSGHCALGFPVEFKDMPDDLDTQRNLPDLVRLEVRGPSGRLTPTNLSGVAVVLDLAGAQPGERTYDIRVRNLNLPSGVAFYRSVPSQITLHFDQLMFKDETVQPVLPVNKPPELSHREPGGQPNRGSKSGGSQDHVQAIHQVKTDPMDLSGLWY